MFNSSILKFAAAALVVGSSFTHNASAAIINFSDLSLSPESYWNGSDESGLFVSNDVVYYNDYNSGYASYAGATYSNITSYTTGAFYMEQYTSAALGGLASNGSTVAGDIYSVVYVDTYSRFSSDPVIDFSALSENVNAIYLSNTAYTVDSLLHGDGFARAFTDGDWMLLTIYGYDANMDDLGTVNFYLADYRDGQTYIATEWTAVSLAAFGGNAEFLNFSISSSDNGEFGMNTPSYFSIGGFDTVAVPEPSTYAAFLGLAALAFVAVRRRK